MSGGIILWVNWKRIIQPLSDRFLRDCCSEDTRARNKCCYCVVATRRPVSTKSSPSDVVPSVNVTVYHGKPPVIRPDDERDVNDDSQPAPRLIYIGEYAGKSAYYSPLRQSIMLGTVHGDTFTEEAVPDAPAAESIDAHIEHLVATARSEDVNYTLSQQALALLIAKRIADAGAMPKGQASAYLLRDVFNISRQDTAAILGVAPSTVDTQRTAGKEKADLAALLTRGLDEITDRY